MTVGELVAVMAVDHVCLGWLRLGQPGIVQSTHPLPWALGRIHLAIERVPPYSYPTPPAIRRYWDTSLG